jgi:hypothetical protein
VSSNIAMSRPAAFPEVAGNPGFRHVVALAKARVLATTDMRGANTSRIEKRQWGFAAAVPDSYGDARYRVELYTRLGSPPKGYVLASVNNGNGFALAVNAGGKARRYDQQHVCPDGLGLLLPRNGGTCDYRREHELLNRAAVKDHGLREALDSEPLPIDLGLYTAWSRSRRSAYRPRS